MFGKTELLNLLEPYRDKPTPDTPPEKWEVGSRDPALFASINAVMDYLAWLGHAVEGEFSEKLGSYHGRAKKLKAALLWADSYEMSLSKAALKGVGDTDGLVQIKKVAVYGDHDPSRIEYRSPTFAFNIAGVDCRKVSERLWKRHAVVVRPGHFFSRALESYGVSGAVRASLVHYNTTTEVKLFLKGVAETAKNL